MTTLSVLSRFRLLRRMRLAGLFVLGLVTCIQSVPGQGVDVTVSGQKTNVADERGVLTIEGTVVDESDSPVPKTRVRLYTYSLMGAVPASLADTQGRFRFSVDLATTRYLVFIADNLKDGRKAYAHIAEEGTLGLQAPLKLVLKQPRFLAVEVRDPKGEPIDDAYIEVADSTLSCIANGRSEPDGALRLTFPADARVGSVLAMKSGRGFDYWTDRINRAVPAPDVPEKLALTLNGARCVRVQAIDSAGQPVSGITVTPWTIKKHGKEFYVNLSGDFASSLVTSKTDKKGIATLDWIPVDFTDGITFLTGSKDFHLPESPSVKADDKEDVVELTMKLLKTTRISGTVLAEDGTPAAGIVLQAEGRGRTNHYYRDVARTNAAGRFVFMAYPDQAYLVAVLDENRAAPSQAIPVIVEGEPVSDVELRLSQGTVLRGVVTGKDGSVRANATVTLVQKTQAFGINVDLVRWAHTDSEGHYTFRIGAGTFDLMDPEHNQKIELKIESQPEVIQDFRAK